MEALLEGVDVLSCPANAVRKKPVNTNGIASPVTCHYNTDMLSVISIEEIETCLFEIQNVSVASSVKF